MVNVHEYVSVWMCVFVCVCVCVSVYACIIELPLGATVRIIQGDKDTQEASPLREGKSQDTSKLVHTQTQVNTHS